MNTAKASAATFVGPNEAATPLHAEARWGVVIVYDDIPAGKRALHTLGGVTHQSSGSTALHPSLWRFDLLEDPDWRAVVTAEAVRASLVVIATSSKGELPAAVRHWVQEWLGQSRETATLAALLGPADDPDAADSPRIQFLKSAAEATRLGFFAPTPPAARPPLAAAASPAPAPSAHHILLVEDDSTVLQFSTKVLARGGYQVTAVEGCEAAWEAIQSASFDLLVTDNQMPGMSGIELVSKLRSAQIGLPVIMASGGVRAEGFDQNPSFQPAIALPKPFTAEQLLETVAEALRRTGRDPPHTEVSFRAYADSCRHWGINE